MGSVLYPQAMVWYKEAVDQSIQDAQIDIGYMYNHGLGVKRDHHLAKLWYTHAAEDGHAVTQNNIGDVYENGIGIQVIYKKVMDWYKISKANDSSVGSRSIRFLYYNGLGVKKDQEKAFYYFNKSIETGNDYAGYAYYGLGFIKMPKIIKRLENIF